jgi:hypothetical protein
VLDGRTGGSATHAAAHQLQDCCHRPKAALQRN